MSVLIEQCIHGLDEGTCSICSGAETARPLPQAPEYTDLAQVPVGRLVGDLRRARLLLEGADVETIRESIDRMKLVREWARLKRAATEVVIEATRLELVALRQLARLGAMSTLAPTQKSVALFLREMSDQEFADLVEGVTGSGVGAVGLVRELRRAKEAADYGRSIASGATRRPVRPDVMELRRAANLVLASVIDAATPVTVADAVSRLADALGDDELDSVTTAGYRAAVRRALRGAAPDDIDTDRPSGCPAFVVYEEDEIGWVHAPWRGASLEQLRLMEALRRSQTEDLLAATDALTAFREESERIAGDRKTPTAALGELWGGQ